MKRLTSAIIGILSMSLMLSADAFASDYSFSLKVEDCSWAPAPKGNDGAPDSTWVPYAKFIQSCPVFAPDHKIAIKILTVRTDLMMKIPNSDAVQDVVDSQVLSADGKLLGTLIGTFPVEYPATVQIRFTNWKRDFPWKITARFKDNVGLGNPDGDDTVFLWNPKLGNFVRQPWSTP